MLDPQKRFLPKQPQIPKATLTLQTMFCFIARKQRKSVDIPFAHHVPRTFRHTFDNPDDYCVDTGGKKLVPREVKITFCHASSTWMGECTCLAHISVGMPCRHMTACMLQMTGRKSGYAPNITMFHHVFHLTPHDVCHENIDSPAGVTPASSSARYLRPTTPGVQTTSTISRPSSPRTPPRSGPTTSSTTTTCCCSGER